MKTTISFITLFLFFQIQAQDFTPQDNLSEDDLPDSIVMLKDKTSDKCFQLKNGNASKGNTLELGNCDQTNTGQQFHLTERLDGSYKFSSMVNRLFCIDNYRYKEDIGLIIRNCRSDNHKKLRTQKIFIEIKNVLDKAEITLSFKRSSRITYVYVDGNDVKQTLDANNATAWKVLLQSTNKVPETPEPKPTPEVAKRTRRLWRDSSLPIKIVYSEDFSKDFKQVEEDYRGYNPLEQALSVWDDAVTSKQFFSFPLTTVSHTESNNLNDYVDGVFGVYKHSSWFNTVSDNALATTRSRFRKKAGEADFFLEEVDIFFNYRDFPNVTLDRNNLKYHDMQSLFVHEIGHLLGLGHREKIKPSVMAPNLDSSEVKRNLEPYDIKKIRNHYESDLSMLRNEKLASKDEYMIIVFERSPNGDCQHYIDDKKTSRH